ncbi:MAG: hypothetical protein PWQ37_814 [Candidatus Petromonas sp.]|jgi:putative sporulation protein YtxC|nr:hypothetical protein [Candidatus Petromonas sp.]
MRLLSIVFKESKDEVKRIAQKILQNYNSPDINIDSEIIEVGKYKSVNFYIDENLIPSSEEYINSDFKNVFKHYAAIIVVDYIIDNLEFKIIEKILCNNYSFLKSGERKFILQQLNKFLEKEFYDKNVDVPYKVNRKAKILYKLMNFLSNNDTVNVEGFVHFRLKNYFEDLNDILDRAIEEYMMEKEYREFIRLLKYFVNVQEPKIELLNVVVDKHGKYHLYDKDNKVIEDKYIRELMDDLLDNDLSYDDMLISSLITIAPKKIVIHYASNIKSNEIIETIKNIFEERVYICSSCRICNLNRVIKEE